MCINLNQLAKKYNYSVTSHLVAPLQPCKLLQSMAKLAGGQF